MNEAEAAAAAEGDPVAQRQRHADLSEIISQQWHSLSAEERKYWDDLAKQRKKEHEEVVLNVSNSLLSYYILFPRMY